MPLIDDGPVTCNSTYALPVAIKRFERNLWELIDKHYLLRYGNARARRANRSYGHSGFTDSASDQHGRIAMRIDGFGRIDGFRRIDGFGRIDAALASFEPGLLRRGRQ